MSRLLVPLLLLPLIACGSWNVIGPATGNEPGATWSPVDATEPLLVVDDSPLDFGEVLAGESAERQVTLANGGDGELRIDDLRIDGDEEFVLLDPVPETVAPGEAVLLRVEFAALDDDEHEATLRIETDDAEAGLVEIPLLAAALAPRILLTPATWVFPGVAVGCTAEVTLEIRNLGNAPLHVADMEYSGDSDLELLDPPDLTAALQPQGVLSVTVRYAPTDLVTDTGQLTVFSNDLDLPALTATQSASAVLGGGTTSESFTAGLSQTWFPLIEAAVGPSVDVLVDGAPVAGWTFIESANAVQFDLGSAPALGSSVQVVFTPASLCD